MGNSLRALFIYLFVLRVGCTNRSLEKTPTAIVSDHNVDTTDPSRVVFNYLSAGCDSNSSKPLVLIFHGYPNIAYGFIDVLILILGQGDCVVAPDQRIYGRNTGGDMRTWAYVTVEVCESRC